MMLTTRLLKVFLLLCFVYPITAQTVVWNVQGIPEKLKEKAHAVIRTDENVLLVKNEGFLTRKKHTVITILDEEGLKYGHLYIDYNKLSKVTDLEGVLYDAAGNKLRKLKKEEINDIGNVSETNLFDDYRYKSVQFNYANFPFTVEYSYEVSDKRMAFYESWFPGDDTDDVSVQASSLQIEMPANMQLRYKEINGVASVEKSQNGANTVYKWKVSNLPIKAHEPYAPAWSERGPGVWTAPATFEMDGYKGDFSTWQKVGEFDNLLNKGRETLPPRVVNEIQTLVKGETTQEAKVKKVYEYLQQHTRYISIQLGIGGLQPFEASLVAEKGYGDCKALSFFTKAMLKTIGIESHYASIKAGGATADILTDFPAQQFNHVILCVPMPKDTIWLECTSQTNPFGYLSNFTANRHTLLATPSGGVLVKTPALSAKDNQVSRKVKMELGADGSAKVKIDASFKGIFYDDMIGLIHENNQEKTTTSLLKNFYLGNAQLSKIALQENRDKIPSVQVAFDADLKKLTSPSGSRLFVTPDIFFKEDGVPSSGSEPRTMDVELFNNISYNDEIEIQLPTYQAVEALPTDVSFTSKFGTFQVKYQLQGNKLLLTRKFTRNNGKYKANDFAELIDFYKKISKADRAQMVLKL
ncbi:DUF3857 domain-containing transglutaminase family protein [Flectobacillus roseus]|uniref:DUF3857 domain-containing protein n=1 Tax=Flectobacillus roseus TaxID=502259 RepID=A0ABT6YD37_9BACT|nr:DUF3857 domain-containing protein [Flectobacillus roseus]MDI9861494.1 DUF3857 domain-containing protein [Flectobacillus roseus]